MKNIRENIKMMLVNQISVYPRTSYSCSLSLVYHTLMETYNIMRYSSSEQIHTKWTDIVKINIPWEVLQTMISKFQGSLGWNVWVLHTTKQSCSTCNHFKWGNPKTQIPSKIFLKIGYGKSSPHINHFLYCCPLISLWK